MLSPTEQHLLQLVEALSTISAHLDRARRQTKNANILALLRVIADHDRIGPSAIADRLHVHRTLAACRIRDCEDAGYVQVSHDPADLRSRLVTLEPAGAHELRRLTQESLRQFRHFFHDWEPDDVRRLTELLEKLRTSMDAAARKRRARSVRSAGEPDWLADFLGH